MSVNLNVVVGGVAKTVAAKPYVFPKKGNLPADYTLTLNGEAAKLARTGGGTYPTYIYVMVGEKPYYLPANVTPDNGSDVKVVKTAEKKVEEELASIEDRGPEGLEDLLPKVEKPAKPARRRVAK